jgi:hypothetical protein
MSTCPSCASSAQFAAGADAELGEDPPQMSLDRTCGQEQLGADLRLVRPSPASRAMRASCAVSAVMVSALRLRTVSPVGDQLPARALGERLHADVGEHVVGCAQLLPRIEASALTAQPFPVQQVRPGELRAQPDPAQPVDRLAVLVLGGRAVA